VNPGRHDGIARMTRYCGLSKFRINFCLPHDFQPEKILFHPI
jgi:hypothetical protein